MGAEWSSQHNHICEVCLHSAQATCYTPTGMVLQLMSKEECWWSKCSTAIPLGYISISTRGCIYGNALVSTNTSNWSSHISLWLNPVTSCRTHMWDGARQHLLWSHHKQYALYKSTTVAWVFIFRTLPNFANQYRFHLLWR